jgi:hypothetical protein
MITKWQQNLGHGIGSKWQDNEKKETAARHKQANHQFIFTGLLCVSLKPAGAPPTR